MRAILALLLLLFTPSLHAAMDAPGRATVSFHLESRGCLYRNETFLQCWESPGEYRITLGGAGTDGAYRVSAGDVIRLVTPEGTARAPLRWWRYLPLIR